MTATATKAHGCPVSEVIAEVEWLMGTDSVERIARRLGYATPNSLARVLHREGRHDLARPFDGAHRAAHRYGSRAA